MFLNIPFEDIRRFGNLMDLRKTGPIIALFQENININVKQH